MQQVFAAVLNFKHKFSFPSMPSPVANSNRCWTYLKASGICTENREIKINKKYTNPSMVQLLIQLVNCVTDVPTKGKYHAIGAKLYVYKPFYLTCFIAMCNSNKLLLCVEVFDVTSQKITTRIKGSQYASENTTFQLNAFKISMTYQFINLLICSDRGHSAEVTLFNITLH